jgi:hypothetical protein
MVIRRRWPTLVGPMIAGLLVAGACSKEREPSRAETAAKAKPAATPTPTPAPPATTLGTLVKVERSDKTLIQGMSLSGSIEKEIKAETGMTFVVLRFEGKGRAHRERESGFVGMGETRPMAKADSGSWLTDAADKKYTPALLTTKEDSCQVSFEIPMNAAGLVWHDGKRKSYQLEPHPMEIIEAPASPGAPAETP